MQKQARITSKGQLTVPKEIRRALGVRSGDRLLFESDSAGVRVRPLRAKSPFEKYRGIGNPGIPPAARRCVAGCALGADNDHRDRFERDRGALGPGTRSLYHSTERRPRWSLALRQLPIFIPQRSSMFLW